MNHDNERAERIFNQFTKIVIAVGSAVVVWVGFILYV